MAKGAKLAHLNPRYVITVGNQMDLTVSDYLIHLADEPDVRTFAVYVEGFRPLDGQRFLEAARRIIASGRHVVLYRARRTAAGAAASASQTASFAGDYAVTRELAQSAGVVVAESLEDFEDLVTLFAALLLAACVTSHPPLPTVRAVELDRYYGTWYEIARLPNWFQSMCVSDTRAVYRPDGENLSVVNRCRTADEEIAQADGVARLVEGSQGAKLRVSFFRPFYGDYWILELDPDYRWVLVVI